MRVNINNTESINVNNSKKEQLKLLEENMQLKLPVDIIKEKMKEWMQEGYYLGWYKSESNLEKPNIAAVYNKFHEETRYFARIIG